MNIKQIKLILLFPLLAFVLFSCNKREKKTLFVEMDSSQTGIEFSNTLNNSDSFNIIDFLYYYDGGGVAIGDINNDGLSDIYLVSNEGKNALYLNKGGLNFEDITHSAGVESDGAWKAGVSMADVNGDGLLDIYLCRLGNYKWVRGHNELYINQGDLTFKEESRKYNLDFSGYSTQAAFFDMDNDGDLDAYMLNHSVHTERSFGTTELRNSIDSLAGDRIYRNDGNYFVDVSEQSGIYRSQIGYGLGIGLTDINNDDFTDIYITNDFLENDYFYLNNGNGTFTESYNDMAKHTSLSSMGNDLADFNNDGLVDIMTLDMLPMDEATRKSTVGDDPHEIFRMKISFGFMKQYSRNTLQLNRGNGRFSEMGMMAGVYATDWSWSPLFADYNNDGFKDLFISNGIVRRPNDLAYIDFIERPDVKNNPKITDQQYLDQMPEGNAHNYFFENKGDLTFIDRSMDWGSTRMGITNGIAYSDLDNDGDLDLVLNNLNEKSTILANEESSDSTNHFLSIEFTGENSNTKSIGAKVTLFAGNEKQYYEQYPVRGFKSSVDQRIHIGLGKSLKADSIFIRWPGGKVLKLYEVEANQMLKVEESLALPEGIHSEKQNLMFTEVASDSLGVSFKHDENTFIEFNREALIPHMNSQEGPAFAIADINGDSLDDLFIGGAKRQEGVVYIQNESGFEQFPQNSFSDDNVAEDVDAVFFDFDNDGDQDLIVVSGGNEFAGDDSNRQPRLYLNDGSGILTKKENVFEGIYQNGSVVAVNDFDNDGWDDIFLGSLTVPWNYGLSPKSFLLKNNVGKGFVNVSNLLPENGEMGMINDAIWRDMDGNGEKDLIVAGEWMNIRIIYMTDGKLKPYEIPNSAGWWKVIETVDYDKDGSIDLIGGNLGLNSKLKASVSEPLRLYINDLDKNGKLEQIMTYYVNGTESIFNNISSLRKQIPSLNDRSNSNMNFSEISPKEIFDGALKSADILEVSELRSGVFLNRNGQFEFSPFPNEMQIGWIQDILVMDIENDGHEEIIIGGNTNASSIQEGWYDGDMGNLLEYSGGNFNLVKNDKTGLYFDGEVRVIKTLKLIDRTYLLAARNDDVLQWFLIR